MFFEILLRFLATKNPQSKVTGYNQIDMQRLDILFSLDDGCWMLDVINIMLPASDILQFKKAVSSPFQKCFFRRFFRLKLWKTIPLLSPNL